MTLTDEASIEHTARGLIDCTLPKREWTHAAHFAAALWVLRYRSDLACSDAFRTLIRRYNDATGTENTDFAGYHHTITVASLGAAGHVLARHAEHAALHEVLEDLLSSEFGYAAWILEYWSRETLFSVEARREWIEPDLKPLPFPVQQPLTRR